MCRKENRKAEKALGAETLAYLIEVDTDLQRVASISDHLIQNLSYFFANKNKDGQVEEADQNVAGERLSPKDMQHLKQAALRVRKGS